MSYTPPKTLAAQQAQLEKYTRQAREAQRALDSQADTMTPAKVRATIARAAEAANRAHLLNRLVNAALAERAAPSPAARAGCRQEKDLREKDFKGDEFVMTLAGNCLSRNDARVLLLTTPKGQALTDPWTRQPIEKQALRRLRAFAYEGVVPPRHRL